MKVIDDLSPRIFKNFEMKVIDLGKLWKFIVDNFLIWNHLVKENFNNFENKNQSSSIISKFNFKQYFEVVNDFKWKYFQLQTCITFWGL
jgi:hypothetical protein